MTRIIGGQSKGRRLKTPRGTATRPTGARVRQSLFDVLAPRLDGCRFLDAFAGTGAIGLEAFSRGASAVVLVDSSAAAIASVRENARAMVSGSEAVRIFRQDALVAIRTLAERGERFHVIYLDPPYDGDLCLRSLSLVASSEILAPGGVAVAEHFHKSPLPETIGRLAQARSLRIGDHVLTFYGSTHEESSPS